MLDFNPERLLWIEDRIKCETGENGMNDCLVVTSPTTIPAGQIFQYGIESKLPYYELRKTGVEVDTMFLMDDKRVVLIQVCSQILQSGQYPTYF